jgi:hypothetical protein
VAVGLTKTHPHIAAILTMLIAIAAVLHNPKVEMALGVDNPDADKK